MVSKQKFVPAELKVLGVCSHSALGRAIEIMLKAIGFGTVEMVTPLEAEKKAQKLDPHLILFTEDYLVSTDGKHLQNWSPRHVDMSGCLDNLLPSSISINTH